jgi:CcmD family protein
MNATHYLYAAYAATWIIHLAYLGTLVRRYKSLRDRVRDFGKNS